MMSLWSRRAAFVAAAIALLAAVYPAYRYYRYFVTHVSTDDAYVDGTIALVSPRIEGTVDAIYVEENWTVREGELLITLDPRDFGVRVERAEAELARARQTVDELYAQVAAAEAGVALSQSQLKQARADYERAKALKDSGVVSGQYYDQAETTYRMALANEALAKHQLAQVRAALGPSLVNHSRYATPLVEQAAAALKAARLDLGYTRITAPFSGIVARKSVHVGHRVQPGQPLMAIVPISNLYVTANFKETQLTEVRVGQRADVAPDIYPGVIYRGHVDSISVGTGAVFSLLPPENATGNWVKVVQRVPVKIVFDDPPPPDKPLRLGLSVVVSVDISDKSGPLLTSLKQHRTQSQGGAPVPRERLRIPPHEPRDGAPAP
jgi:membrane fusion protein (multidrug efflux system)